MKKFIFGILLFFITGLTAYGNTLITSFGTNSNPIFINGDNRNQGANTNAIIATQSYYYNGSSFSRRLNIYNYAGANIGTVELGNGGGGSFLDSPKSNDAVIDMLNGTFVLRHLYGTNGHSYGAYGFYYNKASGTVTNLGYYNWRTDDNSPSGETTGQYNIKYTFDDTYFYVRYRKYTSYYYRKHNLSDGAYVNTDQPVNGYDFTVGYNQYFTVDGANNWYIKSKLTDEYFQYYYDGVTQSVLQNAEPLETVNPQINKLKFIDLNEYLVSEGFNTYQKTIGQAGVNASFTGYLSYVSASETGGTTFDLNLIPNPTELGITNYDRSFSVPDNSYGNYPFAWWSGTGAVERLYWLENRQLYFNGETGFVSGYAGIPGDTEVDGGTGGNGGTGTGAISYDETIWDWDLDGDGDVEFLNGEIFIGIGNFFKYLFEKLIDFFGNIKALIEKLGEAFTDEEKTFSFNFIPSANAQDFSQIINNNVDDVAYKETTLGKIDLFIKGFIAFFILVIGIAFFIGINRRKND